MRRTHPFSLLISKQRREERTCWLPKTRFTTFSSLFEIYAPAPKGDREVRTPRCRSGNREVFGEESRSFCSGASAGGCRSGQKEISTSKRGGGPSTLPKIVENDESGLISSARYEANANTQGGRWKLLR